MRPKHLLSAALLSLAMSLPGSASVIVSGMETGDDVVFSYNGTLDLNGISPRLGTVARGGILARIGLLNFGVPGSFYSFYPLISPTEAPVPFGDGGFSDVSSFTGDLFSISRLTSGPIFGVGRDFTGGAIAGSITFDGASFASLGLTTGTYLYASANDDITMTIGNDMAPVPLPAALPMLLAGLGGFGLMRKLRRSA